MKRTCSFYILLVLLILPVVTQSQVDHHFRFEKLPAEIGFTNSGVNDILQDHQGFLWVATWSGIAKFDGYSVQMYRQTPGNTNGLKSNKITQIYEDSKKRLWIGTNYSGFYFYNRDKDIFEQYCRDPENQNSLSDDNVLAIHEDRNGMLWIGTELGLNRYNPETGQFIKFENDPRDSRSLSHNFVYAISESSDGSLWIGTEEGLNRMVHTGNQSYFIHYDLMPPEASSSEFLTHNFVYKIIPSQFDENTIWICTSNGLKKGHFSLDDPEYFEFEFFGHDEANDGSLSHPFIPDILEESSSKVWVATYQGLDLLDLETGNAEHFIPGTNVQNSISSLMIMCLAKDRTGNLWVGLDKGMNKLILHAKAFRSIIPKSPNTNIGNNVMCLIPSSDRSGMWVGTRGQGLNYLPADAHGNFTSPAQTFTFDTDKFPEQAGFIFNLMLDREGWLWLATDGAGVLRIKESEVLLQRPVLQNFEQFNRRGQISGDYVVSILQSVTNDIWIGYWDKGLDRYNPDTHTFEQYVFTTDRSVNIQEFPIVHMLETNENGKTFLWLGTRGGGVYKLYFDLEKNGLELIHHFSFAEQEEGELSNNFVNCLKLDHLNRLWVGTDNGLNMLDPEVDTFVSYFERDGLRNSIIQSILQDANNNIWVSTQQGISSLYFKDDGPLEIKNFDAFDGLQDNFFNDDASAVTPSGHLVFGGVNGLSVFKPDEIRNDTIPPQIAITDFRLFNESVPIGEMKNGRTVLSRNILETDQICLTHRENVLSFSFTGLHFNEPKNLIYAHQLIGFDPDWVYTDASQRMAYYTNLPYDDFTFRVKAANGDGIWSEPVSVKLTVLPPFWLTGWAYAIYALLVFALIYFGYRIIKMRAEFKHSLVLERIEREKLEEVNKLKLQFFTNISHELRTPLTLIISPLEQLLQKQNDRKLQRLYSRMQYNANRLFTMINQLLDIRKNEAGLLNLHASEGNLVEFAKEITASFKNMSLQRNIRLSFSSDQDQVLVWFDHDQMEKVLFNLLSNAFKFTKDGGRIDVNISQPGPVLIRVSDSGVGIPADQKESIFERFYQVEKSHEWARKGGTGIGLSLAKMIVEKHHGKIEVESEEGKGTAFIVHLLKGKAHFTEKELSPWKDEITGLPGFTLPKPADGSELGDTLPKASESKVSQKAKPLILVVEDNPDIRSYLRENLESNYRISEASDGQEGFEKAFADPPDLIIADIAMPRMDGIEMCGKVKSNLETSHIPVILLTARTSLVYKVDGLEIGADDYVTKPFHMRLLATRIKNLIVSRKSLKDHFSKSYDLSPSGIALNSLDEQLLLRMKTVIEKHIDDSNFSVDQLAKALQMSRAKQYRKIKALTGKSPNQIIRGFRLKRASQLLETGQYNISDVAYMIGYNDVKSFREQFKKEFGMNPSSYTLEN